MVSFILRMMSWKSQIAIPALAAAAFASGVHPHVTTTLVYFLKPYSLSLSVTGFGPNCVDKITEYPSHPRHGTRSFSKAGSNFSAVTGEDLRDGNARFDVVAG